jgi:hypothetical protein
MSRAMNVNATEAEVTRICLEKGAIISAIENLPSGGTRVVFTSGDAATAMRAIFGSKLITGPVARTAFQQAR